ncbi:hypothetical protein SK355_13895 [Candidatus Fukatsuia symbiotica]|uniref:Uncharacterized protein n=1 Tax=Candidatus Fukatsuia symbiotica TaxID=1878942 RepID=A0A2U8I913_9GAMM|nr:hypothetical protein [Candidatus Fukatsuia symbiotica]AWK15603.1 hypothetical protein CCS41_14375 [Candidatus Fukatsuia symbiotica]MEA9446240.1 hypothetical protein [Candidatus Fukatsuia symbiotica]
MVKEKWNFLLSDNGENKTHHFHQKKRKCLFFSELVQKKTGIQQAEGALAVINVDIYPKTENPIPTLILQEYVNWLTLINSV